MRMIEFLLVVTASVGISSVILYLDLPWRRSENEREGELRHKFAVCIFSGSALIAVFLSLLSVL
jgi:hypothetical protein